LHKIKKALSLFYYSPSAWIAKHKLETLMEPV
jgi:hypothetical protein